METRNITALRQEAHSLLNELPVSTLPVVTETMWSIPNLMPPKIRKEHSEAFKRLEELCRPIPDLDEKKELAEWWEEKYGIVCSD